ncbi:MAG: hybrid sensor histidine kinase/response regulator [Alteromonadaceae bacterium]|uniref:PAS domain-containing hybrid sensor histidine kinase/response regulator n=1 Tax=Paraglaciecola chathamensis TaxID=368405 RepID=UPI000C48E52B|nr:PAS-domain containing protein [Paraglaciecola agarilytica]MBN23772.1 hybrid sensor histidine kinase/response regulator [Alteromonadaceae bacterium]|tara:strand:- start:56 stop:3460 length:3405 start_codon:yes stop_codon:yes gene_type:complete
MFSVLSLMAIVVGYLLILFLLAFWGDKRAKANQQHPYIYSLALGVHCTSWAFFGTTTQAAHYGWAFIPTYMGIICVFLFAHPVLRRVANVCHQHNISSLADFISLRYDKSHFLAALVTLLCFIGVVPYIALQLDAVTGGIRVVTGADNIWPNSVGFYVAILMALFAILFGTRSLNLTDKHPGLMLTVAFESIVKLVGLIIVGLFVCYSLFDGVFDLLGKAQLDPRANQTISADSGVWVYASQMLLGVCSMFCLPRQFHINFIENNGDKEITTARWLFPLYLLGMTLFVLPIALAGHMLFPGGNISTDTYALALPVASGNTWITIIAFIGGLAAATSMIIVATLAMGIMISNNIATPLWLTLQLRTQQRHRLKPASILLIRRATVLVVLGVAYFYHVNISQSTSLVQSGVIAIALLSQTFPILLLGLYWKRGTTLAAQLALASGALCWVYWLLWPSITASYYFNDTPTDIQLAQGFVYSLGVNILCFVLVSLIQNKRSQPSTQDPITHNSQPFGHAVKVANLLAITEKVWGSERHQALLDKLSPEQLSGYASPKLLTTIESELAGQVGSASARILLSAIGEKRDVELSELVELVEEASQTFQFNHELLQSSVENIQQGIVVLDRDLNLLAWNQRYIELFNYPRGFVQVGMSIHQLLEFNAKRGLFGHNAITGQSNIEMEIEKRVTFMQSGSAYKYVRHQENGQVIELNGRPLPGGGFVTTYSDITEYINIQQQLEQAKTGLETRVQERTEQLQIANINLEKARRDAESANESKTKFLAAAGHDLMQPFNAASLFAAMLKQKAPAGEMAEMSANLVDSLSNAESLLSMLLDMTRLESGVLSTHIQTFPLDSILRPMVTEFSVLAQQKRLRITYISTSISVKSDPKLLRRIIQNLLSNAIRYTHEGRILVGVKRQAGTARICVIDTGAGIAKDKQQEIFLEFHQLDNNPSAQGLGLGLTIVERISALLNHPVTLHSTLNKGTSFDITVPMGAKQIVKDNTIKKAGNDASLPLKHKRVLIVDNEPHILDALHRLLVDWGADVVAAKNTQDALNALSQPIDLMILDYQLDNGETGIDVARAIRQSLATASNANLLGILNSARQDEDIRQLAINEQMHYLPKPLKPLALKRLIKQLLAEK